MQRETIPESLSYDVHTPGPNTWTVANGVLPSLSGRVFLECGPVVQSLSPEQARAMAWALNEVADRAVERSLWLSQS